MPQTDEETNRTVLTTEEARQGRTSGHVRAILFASLLLAVLAGIAFWAYYN
ncbi:MAG: hypothetical protein KKB37_12310 [Alphaproteobacteria bacterium]|nr:hypothetical protein [Alphaproteobacteria bacterium]